MQIRSLITFALLLVAFFAPAQNKKKPELINDEYKGTILPSNEVSIATILRLTHEPYADDGRYELNEMYAHAYQNNRNTMQRQGQWTVLKGSAADDNATVVELDDKNQKPIYYYLRLKNGDLQQLDSTLHELKPIARHLLTKQTPDRRTIVIKPRQTPEK